MHIGTSLRFATPLLLGFLEGKNVLRRVLIFFSSFIRLLGSLHEKLGGHNAFRRGQLCHSFSRMVGAGIVENGIKMGF